MPTRSRGPCSFTLVGSLALLVVVACEPDGETRTPSAEPGPPACAGLDGFAVAWNPERRRALATALAEQPGEWSEQLLASLDAQLPALERRWTDARSDACAAASTRPASASTPWSSCLDAQVWGLDAVIALILEDPERAPSLWERLDRSDADPSACASARTAGGPLPWARGVELASVPLLIELGEFERARGQIDAIAADPQVHATPHVAWSLALARVAVEIAAGQLDAAARALADAEPLAATLGFAAAAQSADARANLAVARHDLVAAAEARADAVGAARDADDPWLLVAELDALARFELERGEPSRAVAGWVEAIGLLGRLTGPDNPRTAVLQRQLAAAQRELGQIEAAHDALTQARDTLVIALGPDHPETLATVEAIGRLFVASGNPGDAQFAFLDLLEVYGELYGAKHWRTAMIKLELADSLMAVDQHASAQALYTEALMPLAQALGATHPAVVRTSVHLGIAELALGDLEAAQPHCRRGRDLAGGLGLDHPLVGEADGCLDQIAKALAKPPGRRPPR